MTIPKPEPGLVIHYSYLWESEQRTGREEGAKDRPCAIVLATTRKNSSRVLVVPVTHRAPAQPEAAMELPAAVKRILGLDEQRSWIVLSESNLFGWPGPDLRRVGSGDKASVAYGFLPPRFFAEVKRRFLALEAAAGSRRVSRTE